MRNKIQVTGSSSHNLHVRTPGRYAMDIAIEILKFLDEQENIIVKNTGWKDGFGLEVGSWLPIKSANLQAELSTDGDELQIRRVSGSIGDFEELHQDIQEFIRNDLPPDV